MYNKVHVYTQVFYLVIQKNLICYESSQLLFSEKLSDVRPAVRALDTAGEFKVHPRTGHEGTEEEQRYSTTLSLTSALYGVGGQRHTPAAIPLGKRPSIHSIGGCVDPRNCLDRCRKSRPPTGFDPRTVQPVASRYTD